jgi:hypothetical protein
VLTREQVQELLQKALVDPAPFLSKIFHITTKGLAGQPPVMPLVPNAAQQKVLDAIAMRRAEGRPPRLIVLKARQPGISTLCEALVTLTAMASPYTTSMILTDLDESSEKLFDKCKFALDRMPDDIRPIEKRRKQDLLSLDYILCTDGELSIDSQIHVATASGREVWRGMTLRAVHCSEFAKFPYPASTLDGLIQSVPKTMDSLVIIESTARGEGNVFHDEWKRAVAGESDYVAVFIPWYELPDCFLPVPAQFKLKPHEKSLRELYSLSLEQVSWFRYVFETECRGNWDTFHQEYPATAEEAFLTSGNPAFPMKPLAQMADRARKVTAIHRAQTGDIVEVGDQRRFVRNPDGPLTIYRMPVPGHDYTLGADAAAGVEDGDYLCAQVLDRQTVEVVATWHGRMSPMEFGRKIILLGGFYHWAILAPEITGGHGSIVIDQVKRSFYPRIYVYQRMDKIKNTVTNFIGWETNMRTRGLLFDTMHWFIGNAEIMIWDIPTIQEFREMRYVTDQRAEGLHHDDRAMAAMIALRCHFEMPMIDTGLPPQLVLPAEEKPTSLLPDMPPDAISQRAWKDTDVVLRGMRAGHGKTMMDEYGPMPDEAEEEAWNPTERNWIPEVPW